MRKFPNWLDAYFDYARDYYCPDMFHHWTGISVLGGALERKTWLNQGMIKHYPNMYILLVSHPAVGKSTALERGVDLLEDIRENINAEFKVIPNQITEPGLIDAMKLLQEIRVGEKFVFHSSGYFYASEASSSALQNLFGDFNATITAFYDCPRIFRKKIKSEKEMTEIPNVCFNLLAGATFDYLKNLVNEVTVMGGLASRFIYVICKDRKVRESKWGDMHEVDTKMRSALLHDLEQIHKLQGAFRPDSGYISAWEKYQPEFDRELIALNSPKLESLSGRKMTNTIKLSMILSASESNDMNLTVKHWDKAKEMIEEVSKDNSFVLSQAMIADKQSQSGANQLISQLLKKAGGKLPMRVLKTLALSNGNSVDTLSKTIDYMVGSGWLTYDSASGIVELTVDPDRYL